MECGDSSPLSGEGFSLHRFCRWPWWNGADRPGWNPISQSMQWRERSPASIRALGGPFSGGTCLSGPSVKVGSSIRFHRGLKSRAKSGAKAPHSIWSAAIHRRFLVKALAFTGFAVGPGGTELTGRGGTRSPNPCNGGNVPRPPFVPWEVRFPEGPACRVRRTAIDDPSLLSGHDKRAPPTFSGGTCLSRPLCNVR
jgi:hypothetical protein